MIKLRRESYPRLSKWVLSNHKVLIEKRWDFPSSPGVATQRFQCRGHGFDLHSAVKKEKQEKRGQEGQRQSWRGEDRGRDQRGAGCEPRVRATVEAGNPPGYGVFLRACHSTSDSCLPEPKRISLCHLKPLCWWPFVRAACGI